ncbi:DUF7426 family protein [Streptomyces odonnellii]|uniref:DUF7426 family protein n=1 Tax=Streptomyces odonnellii TaxID=1417980 RepID=UPI0006250BBF|nr:hypothetical protein [Streptomyces odonnellii]
MGRFKALDDFQDDALTLPVRFRDGTMRDVIIPGPSAEVGLKIQKVMESGLALAVAGADPSQEVLDDARELDLYRDALGPRHDELLAGLDWPFFKHVAITAVLWIAHDSETAERYWTAGGDPSRQAPNRETRRASSAAAKSTRTRGSTSGTSTRPAKPRAAKKAADQT